MDTRILKITSASMLPEAPTAGLELAKHINDLIDYWYSHPKMLPKCDLINQLIAVMTVVKINPSFYTGHGEFRSLWTLIASNIIALDKTLNRDNSTLLQYAFGEFVVDRSFSHDSIPQIAEIYEENLTTASPIAAYWTKIGNLFISGKLQLRVDVLGLILMDLTSLTLQEAAPLTSLF